MKTLFIYLVTILGAAPALAHEARTGAPPKAPAACDGLLRAPAVPVDWNQAWLKPVSGELKRRIEREPGHPLLPDWLKAQARVGAIEAAVHAMPDIERDAFTPVVRALQAALTKHQLEFLRERQLSKLDVPRHLAILRAIAAYNPDQARFSLYKIKRVIEGRHSLTEYIDCRMGETVPF
jgi:hypothetical protein